MPRVLNEIEDRMVAMTEGEWIDLATGKSILESWFTEVINEHDLREMCTSLASLGLVRTRVDGIECGPEDALLFTATLMQIELMASKEGEGFLRDT